LGPKKSCSPPTIPIAFLPTAAPDAFLEAADLSGADRQAIAHGAWERMTSSIRRG
jgi:hypothetical protein